MFFVSVYDLFPLTSHESMVTVTSWFSRTTYRVEKNSDLPTADDRPDTESNRAKSANHMFVSKSQRDMMIDMEIIKINSPVH